MGSKVIFTIRWLRVALGVVRKVVLNQSVALHFCVGMSFAAIGMRFTDREHPHMATLTKERIKPNSRPASLLAGEWSFLLPFAAEQSQTRDVHEMRDALQQAEAVMRAQEERILLLERMAQTDELTGLANRRGFITAFDRELARARRDAGCGGVLVMVDLDGFKGINDRWGHAAGDAYLRVVAQVLQKSVRAVDVVARLGGDEFVLLLTQMGEETGSAHLTRLEQSFNRRSMALSERISAHCPERVPLRASFGLCAYSGSDQADAVMRAADAKLYAHKARNKVTASAQ